MVAARGTSAVFLQQELPDAHGLALSEAMPKALRSAICLLPSLINYLTVESFAA
jgi:hypothetical protein